MLKHSNQSQQSWAKTKKLDIFQYLPHRITVVFRLGRGFVERKIEWSAERLSWLSQSEVWYNKTKVTQKLISTFLHFLLLAWSFLYRLDPENVISVPASLSLIQLKAFHCLKLTLRTILCDFFQNLFITTISNCFFLRPSLEKPLYYGQFDFHRSNLRARVSYLYYCTRKRRICFGTEFSVEGLSWLFSLESKDENNTPLVRSGHMVRNKLSWDATDTLAPPKQKNSFQSCSILLCF